MKRIPTEQLFDADLNPVGDNTLFRLVSEAERRFLQSSDPGYREALAEEMLQTPEAV